MIKDLKATTRIEELFLISAVHDGVTNNGAPYLSISLQDKTGTIDAKFWDVKENQKELCEVGTVRKFKGDVIEYKGHLQLKANEVEIPDILFDPADFRMSAPVDVDSLKNEVEKAVDSLSNQIIKDVVTTLLKKAGEQFFVRPAAVKNHHEFDGGLATHVVSMLHLAYPLVSHYPMLNHDLLIGGVLIHDIGKLEELSSDIVPQYTLQGKLLGHISIGNAMISKVAEELGYSNKEEVVLLQHLVLSHHGQYEYGSPVLPCIPEAEALHMIDNLDARMEMLKKTMETTKEHTFSARMLSLDNRQFYKFEDK